MRKCRKLNFLYLSRFTESAIDIYSTKQLLLKILQIHRKRPVLESLFNKVAGLKLLTLSKKTPALLSSSEFCQILINTFFAKYLRTTVSGFTTFSNSLFFQNCSFHDYFSPWKNDNDVYAWCQWQRVEWCLLPVTNIIRTHGHIFSKKQVNLKKNEQI